MNFEPKKEFEFLKKFYSGHKSGEDYESLDQHSIKTLDVFKRYINLRRIKFNFESLGYEKKQELVKLLEEIIFLHDLGKINPHSQEYYKGLINKSSETEHSQLSFILIFLKFYNQFAILKDKRLTIETRNEDHIFAEYLLVFSYCVSLHHTNLSGFQIVKSINDGFKVSVKERIIDILNTKEKIIREILSRNFPEEDIENSISKLKDYFNKDVLSNQEKEVLFFDIKLFYSLLVLSDYYATYSFQFNRNIKDLEINQIDNKLLMKMEDNFHKISYNSRLQQINDITIKKLSECNNINDLRNNLIIQATQTLNNEIKKNKKIFMLNVPTGGGKTNISLKLSLEILKQDKSINRLNWVFPYVNIIEQNYKVIRKAFLDIDKDIDEEDKPNKVIAKIHYDTLNLSKEELIDYDNNFNEIIETDLNISYVNNPINIISNVNFFDALFKIKRDNRYKFANFINSIVIIDEIQTLNLDYMNIFYRILDDVSKNYNIYFIIMSATLPNLNNYTNKYFASELIQNHQNYFNHDVFKRNDFVFVESTFDLTSLMKYFQEKIITIHKEENKFLIVVNTIKSSIEIFKQLNESQLNKIFKIFLLNSYVSGKDRDHIIKYIKNSQKDKIILVSTQSIEAGVDLDFDIGLRDKATLDSIEQVAGRINRECNLSKNKVSKLYIFDLNNESRIYRNDLRFELLSDINTDEQKDILNNKKFEDYYNKYFDKIKNIFSSAKRCDYVIELEKLNFEKIHKDLNIIERRISLRLIFDPINRNAFENKLLCFLDKYTIKSVKYLLALRKDKLGFEFKPYLKVINQIINKNSISIDFFDNSSKDKFLDFIKYKEYFISEISPDTIIIHLDFKKKYIKQYINGGTEYNYLDLSDLRNDFKNYSNSSNEAIFI